jgi:hypothetical protein
LAEPAQSRLVLATKVVEPVVPPPSAGADNLGGEQSVAEATVSQVALEQQIDAVSGGDDVVMVSLERIVPPPPPSRDHEAIASAVTETPIPAAQSAGGV